MSAIGGLPASEIRHLNRLGVQIDQTITIRATATPYPHAIRDNFAAISATP
tara:strand:+ start:656 stop:808 length:153 start_codon:yes stop_codon:yes gene_type:complete